MLKWEVLLAVHGIDPKKHRRQLQSIREKYEDVRGTYYRRKLKWESDYVYQVVRTMGEYVMWEKVCPISPAFTDVDTKEHFADLNELQSAVEQIEIQYLIVGRDAAIIKLRENWVRDIIDKAGNGCMLISIVSDFPAPKEMEVFFNDQVRARKPCNFDCYFTRMWMAFKPDTPLEELDLRQWHMTPLNSTVRYHF